MLQIPANFHWCFPDFYGYPFDVVDLVMFFETSRGFEQLGWVNQSHWLSSGCYAPVGGSAILFSIRVIFFNVMTGTPVLKIDQFFVEWWFFSHLWTMRFPWRFPWWMELPSLHRGIQLLSGYPRTIGLLKWNRYQCGINQSPDIF